MCRLREVENSLSQNSFHAAEGSLGCIRQIESYRATAARLFPEVPAEHLLGLSESDAWLMALFLECRSEKTLLLEVREHASLVPLYLADRPEVIEVISVGAKEAFALETLLAEFPVREKVRIVERGLVSALSPPEGASTVALINLSPCREGIREALEEVLGENPEAIVVLAGCRGEGGPFIQAGAVDFLDGVRGEHRFRLFGDLAPGLASCGLGVVYRQSEASSVEKTLERLEALFSRRFDPLELLERERALISIVNRHREENERLEERVREAEQKNAYIKAHYSSRRYRVVDAIMDRFRRHEGGK